MTMAEVCTVAADDIRAVAGLLAQAKVLSQWLTAIPAFDPAYEAAARMCAALEQPSLPPCPVSPVDEMAITDRHTLDAYLGQDFDRSEAFEVLRMLIAMRCNLTLAAVSRG